jgi:WD40 repeat protein
MPNNDDFFSPDQLDERLELSPRLHHPGESAKADPNIQFLHTLRNLYEAEEAENARSLQRVWERLAQQHTSKPQRLLYMLKPLENTLPPPAQAARHSNRRMFGRRLLAFVASIFVFILVGGMLIIVHAPLAGFGATNLDQTALTPSPPLQGYPFPGRNIATSPASPDDFYALTWSQNPKRLALATQNRAWIWDMNAGQYTMIAEASAPAMNLRTLSWSPDGRYLAIGNNPVQVIDPTTDAVSFTYPVHAFWPAVGNDYQAVITALAWSPDSSFLAIAALRSGNGCVVQIWDVPKGLLENSFESEACKYGISSISWSADAQYIASADGITVQAWEALTSKVIFKQSIDTNTSVAWSPQNTSQLAFVNNNTAQVWDIAQNSLVSQYAPATNGVLTWSPDSNYIATADSNQVTIWDALNGAHLYTYTGNTHYVRSLAWSPDGSSLASGESSTSQANFARIWSA